MSTLPRTSANVNGNSASVDTAEYAIGLPASMRHDAETLAKVRTRVELADDDELRPGDKYDVGGLDCWTEWRQNGYPVTVGQLRKTWAAHGHSDLRACREGIPVDVSGWEVMEATHDRQYNWEIVLLCDDGRSLRCGVHAYYMTDGDDAMLKAAWVRQYELCDDRGETVLRRMRPEHNPPAFTRNLDGIVSRIIEERIPEAFDWSDHFAIRGSLEDERRGCDV
jgi:hypothetical protein